ncbi:hypothetical protein NE237_003873 [Protea cynaroides]|uniref:Uncharacterized protein n=1 Tax=Protea cynaroides TaxID=273540 RepID=A0A9Q0KHW4_9MAGN|nr:hypothetical protein NE237_003873 [Protea cynaroides]
MEKNQPVVLTGLTDGWRACRDWVNLQYFSSHFGYSRVEVADCGRESSQIRRELRCLSQTLLVIGLSFLVKIALMLQAMVIPCYIYLKDWHFVKVRTGIGCHSLILLGNLL